MRDLVLRLMRHLARVLAVGSCAAVALVGCSSSKHATPPASTTTEPSSTSTTTGSTSTSASTSSTTAASPTTTTATVPTTLDRAAVTGLTSSPASPVSCNAPTMIQLSWQSVLLNSVDLSIDGTFFASYGGGPQSHLEYLACDGKAHTYKVAAKGGSPGATLVVTSKPR